MKSRWWILCALLLLLGVGCNGKTADDTEADNSPSTELTPEEEAAEPPPSP